MWRFCRAPFPKALAISAAVFEAATGCTFTKSDRVKTNEAEHNSRSHDAMIHVYDLADNVIKTHEHVGEFKDW